MRWRSFRAGHSERLLANRPSHSFVTGPHRAPFFESHAKRAEYDYVSWSNLIILYLREMSKRFSVWSGVWWSIVVIVMNFLVPLFNTQPDSIFDAALSVPCQVFTIVISFRRLKKISTWFKLKNQSQKSKSSPESDPKLVDLLFFELSQKFDCQEPNQACFDAIFDTDYEHLQRVAWLKSIIAPVAIVIREKTLCMLPWAISGDVFPLIAFCDGGCVT